MTAFSRCQACDAILGARPRWMRWEGGGGGAAHVSGGDTQDHLCGWRTVRSCDVLLMNSLHAVEMAAIIIACFMCL